MPKINSIKVTILAMRMMRMKMMEKMKLDHVIVLL
jgi:hypothetical protein